MPIAPKVITPTIFCHFFIYLLFFLFDKGIFLSTSFFFYSIDIVLIFKCIVIYLSECWSINVIKQLANIIHILIVSG